MSNVAILGGTYNPPHFGHKRLIEAFTKKYNFDKILIIPTYTPPHKSSKDLVSSEDRLNMCKLAFKEPIFEVSDIEIKRKGKSYTYLTLKELKEKYKDANFYLIIGSDMLLSFHTWKNTSEIFDMCTVCAASREDEIGMDRLNVYTKSYFPDREIELIEFKPLEISSTELRKMFRENRDTSKYVDKSVLDYIKCRGLYNAGNGGKL